MSKYVFKNPEVEKALRLVSKELGVSDEKFDEDVQLWGRCSTIYILDEDGNTVVDFPSILLKEHKEFNPNGWNESDVIPPKDPNLEWASVNLIIEDAFDKPHIGYYHYESKNWVDIRNDMNITCKRYCLYPKD